MNIAKKNLTTLAEACEKMPLYTRTEYEKLKAENAALKSQITNMETMMRLLVCRGGADSHPYTEPRSLLGNNNVFEERRFIRMAEAPPRRSARLAELAARSSQ